MKIFADFSSIFKLMVLCLLIGFFAGLYVSGVEHVRTGAIAVVATVVAVPSVLLTGGGAAS